MKVALFTSTFLPNMGGAELVVHNIALALRDKGVDVTVMTWWRLWRRLGGVLPYRVRPFLPRSFTPEMRTDARALRRKMQTASWQVRVHQWLGRYDVWHIHFAFPNAVMATGALRAMHVPNVVTCHGSDIQKDPQIGYGVRLVPFVEDAIREALKRASLVTALSASNYGDIASLNIPDGKICSIENGIWYDLYANARVNRSDVLARYNLPTDRKIILTVARNEGRKGYHLLPAIIRSLLQYRKDFVWVVIGHDTEGLPDKWRDPEIMPYVRVLGQVGECVAGSRNAFQPGLAVNAVIPLFKCADVFAFPSLLEAFGVVLIEAMAAGVPVITTNAIGCRDVVKHDETGFVVEVGSAEAMAEGIRQVLDNEALKNKLITQGRLFAERLDWSNIADKYIQAYEKAIELPR